METAIVAALVSAAVSLVGILVNFRLTREARRAAVEQLRMAAGIAETRDAISHLRKYTSDVERLRAIAMSLEMMIGVDAASSGRLTEQARAFDREVDDFLRSWADVKPDIPDIQLEYVRTIRHACKNHAAEVQSCLRQYTQSSDGLAIAAERETALVAALRRFVTHLDHLFSLVNNLRNEKIAELIAAMPGDRHSPDARNSGRD